MTTGRINQVAIVPAREEGRGRGQCKHHPVPPFSLWGLLILLGVCCVHEVQASLAASACSTCPVLPLCWVHESGSADFPLSREH